MHYTHLLLLPWLFGHGASLYHIQSMTAIKPPTPLPNNSYFGFSITYDQRRNKLIISAPNSEDFDTLYSCSINSTCDLMKNIIRQEPQGLVNRDKEQYRGPHVNWVGATVMSTADGLVICAPRLIKRIEDSNYHFPDHVGMFGRCYLAQNGKGTKLSDMLSTDRSEYCDAGRNRICDLGKVMDTLGWSIDVNGHSLLIGGSGLVKGRTLLHNDVRSDVAPKMVPAKVLMSADINYKFGEAVSFGNFLPGKHHVYAASSTYERGKILLLSEKKIERQLSEGEQTGARFGAVLCAVRRAGRGDALLVGAPAHAARDLARASHDAGAIVVLNPTSDNVVIRTIEGVQDGGMFGSAIANLGDIDGDDIDDVAISAPFEDGGSGAVYVYSGAALVGEGGGSWLQRIQPRGGGARGFGLSLHAFRDPVNNRTCKDLAIGAPLVDHVTVIKCMSTAYIKVHANIPNLQNRTNIESFVFQSCIYVVKMTIPNTRMNFAVKVRLSHNEAKIINKSNAKVDEITYMQEIYYNDKSLEFCENITVDTPKNGDYGKDIMYQILASPHTLEGDGFDPNFVAVSGRSELMDGSYIIAADCDARAGCKPTLAINLTHTFRSPYVIGSTKTENVTIAVHNAARGAVYGACLRLRTEGVRLRVEGPQNALTNCESSAEFPTPELKCQLLIPLLENDTWVVGGEFLVETEGLTSASAGVVLRAAVYNHACAGADALQTASASVTLQAEPLLLEGASDLGNPLNLTKYEIQFTNKQLRHIYTIKNNGVTNWKNLKCDVLVIKEPYLNLSNVYFINFEHSTKVQSCQRVEKGSSGLAVFSCLVGNLRRESKGYAYIYAYIDVLAGSSLDTATSWNKAKATSRLEMFDHNNVFGSANVTTQFLIEIAPVPIWILIISSIIGLLLLYGFYRVLKEFGLLRRKKQDDLSKLKRMVRRQSTRREAENSESGSARCHDSWRRRSQDGEQESSIVRSSNTDQLRRSETATRREDLKSVL